MKAASTLDHLVVTSPNLKSGVQWVRDVLGVTPELGGKHPRMGTHNCLLRLGEQTYLEVISPDPNAPDPGRPRWFGLDQLGANASPRLAAWVARTTNIGQAVAASSEYLGTIEPMTRGGLNWLITVTEDGSLPLDGIAPILIEWQTPSHPATGMRDAGCRLMRLNLVHPDQSRAAGMLDSIACDRNQLDLKPAGEPLIARIVAEIETPGGVQTLPTT